MGLFPSPSPATSSLPLLLLLSLLAPAVVPSDYTTLVYKGCAGEKFKDPTGTYSQTLNTLFKTLVSQSSAAKFYKTTAGESPSAITGLFQCRGDLSNADCSNCVGKTPDKSRKLCGDVIAARVQLTGCYMRYEVAGFNQVPATEFLYKVCGSTRASGAGFEDRLGSALEEVEKGVAGGNGFYTGSNQSVFVLGQCEGDLASADCVDCVKTAVDRAKSDCGAAISGQVYLQMCYISYTYYPNGVPSESSMSSGEGGKKGNTEKTVAIVVGGLAGFGLWIAFLMVIKSAFKKREGKYGG